MNRLVTVALWELLTWRKAVAFRRAIAAIQADNAAIALEFTTAESDGLD